MQLVLMALRPNEDIEWEVHTEDQFFRVEQGAVVVESPMQAYSLVAGQAAIVCGGTKHHVIAGPVGAKLYTIYAPAHHPPATRQHTKPR
jgi:mannose-6-phosphate isomerase-like protein (cupin superfamily)